MKNECMFKGENNRNTRRLPEKVIVNGPPRLLSSGRGGRGSCDCVGEGVDKCAELDGDGGAVCDGGSGCGGDGGGGYDICFFPLSFHCIHPVFSRDQRGPLGAFDQPFNSLRKPKSVIFTIFHSTELLSLTSCHKEAVSFRLKPPRVVRSDGNPKSVAVIPNTISITLRIWKNLNAERVTVSVHITRNTKSIHIPLRNMVIYHLSSLSFILRMVHSTID